MQIILEPFTAHQKGHKELICPNFTSLCAGVCLSYFSSTIFLILCHIISALFQEQQNQKHTTYTHKKKVYLDQQDLVHKNSQIIVKNRRKAYATDEAAL